MKTRLFKALAFLLVFAMCVSLLSACGQGGGKNAVSPPSDESGFLKMNVKAAEAALREAGFEQITLNSIEDVVSSGDTGDGAVSAVSIDGSSDYTIESKFNKAAEVVITYHTVKRLAAPISAEEVKTLDYMEAGKKFFDAGFTNIETDEVSDLPDGAEYETVVTVNGDPFTEMTLPYDAKISVIGHYPVQNFSTTINIDFIPNWFFSKYDVQVSLNGENLGKLAHGKDGSYELMLPAGKHELVFSEDKDSEVSGSVSFTVDSETTAEYQISCYASHVEVKEQGFTHALADDSLLTPFSSGHFLRKNCEAVVDELKALGFENVKAVPTTDHLWNPSEFNSVVAIKAGNTTGFGRGTMIEKATPVSVMYHKADFAFKEATASVTEKDTFDLPYTLTSDSLDSLRFEIDHPEVLQRNEDGSFTALIPGTATVTVFGGDMEYSSCTVEVAEIVIPIERIEFEQKELDLVVGSMFTPSYIIVPENANYTDMTVQVSGPAIEQCDDGSFYANEPGDIEISYYQDERLVGSFTVHATVVDLESIALNEEIKEVNMGESVGLSFVLTPENATCKGISVASSNPAAAEVAFDERGEPIITVSGISAGKAKITVTIPNGTKYTQDINVLEVLPTEISVNLSDPSGEYEVGDLITFDVTWTPENTSLKELAWKTSDKKVIAVNEDGTLEAVGVGSAVLTAQHKSGLTAELTVTVVPTPVESINLANPWDSSEAFSKGKQFTLTAEVLPENATDKSLVFTSDNETVLTVSEQGEVTAVKAGTATVTATSPEGASATITITVDKMPMPVMPGTSLAKAANKAGEYGVSRLFDDDFGHGARQRSFEKSRGGLTLDVIYSSSTNEVLGGQIVTFNGLSSAQEQRDFIKGMASVLCPEADAKEVSAWVAANVGGKAKKTINGFVYEVGQGPSGNLLYYAGIENWEEWDLQY